VLFVLVFTLRFGAEQTGNISQDSFQSVLRLPQRSADPVAAL
jgi:hypothetical protein